MSRSRRAVETARGGNSNGETAAPSRRIELSRLPALDVALGIKNDQPRRPAKTTTARASNRQKQNFLKNRFPRLGPKYLSPFPNRSRRQRVDPDPSNDNAIPRPTWISGFEG